MEKLKKLTLEELAKKAAKFRVSKQTKFCNLMEYKHYERFIVQEELFVWFKQGNNGFRVLIDQKLPPHICEYAELKPETSQIDYATDVYRNLHYEDTDLIKGISIGIGFVAANAMPSLLRETIDHFTNGTPMLFVSTAPKIMAVASTIAVLAIAYYAYNKKESIKEREERQEKAMKCANVFVNEPEYAILRALAD